MMPMALSEAGGPTAHALEDAAQEVALPPGSARWVIALCRAGIAARGIVFGLIGILLIRAAARRDPDQAGGIRESLEMLAGMGRWPLAAVALGLVAYALYELLNAKYRRIRVT
jgi:hypothetical protein